MNLNQLLVIDRCCKWLKIRRFSLILILLTVFSFNAFAADSPLSSVEHSSSALTGATPREVSVTEPKAQITGLPPRPAVAELPSSIEVTSPLTQMEPHIVSNVFPSSVSFSGRGFVTVIKMGGQNLPTNAIRTLDDGTKIIYGKLQFLGNASRKVKSNEEILWCQGTSCSEDTFPMIVGVKQLINSFHPFQSKSSLEQVNKYASLDSAMRVALKPIISEVSENLEGNKTKITATVKAPSYEEVIAVLKPVHPLENSAVDEVKQIALKQQPGTDVYSAEMPLPRGTYSYGIEVKFEDQTLIQSLNRSLTIE